ncbi:MAG: hypothetical protein AB1742_08660 [bacterium]
MVYLLNEGRIRQGLVPVLRGLITDTLGAAGRTGCTLKTAALYGSVVGKDFVPGRSDVNVLLVFESVKFDLLRELRGAFRRHAGKLRANPVVIDEEYIRGSADVFPMEFLEWKQRSLVIYGEDALEGIEVAEENLRLEIEENLRGKKLRLTQSYFEAPRGRGKLQGLAEGALANFAAAFRGILRLKGMEAKGEFLDTLDALSGMCGSRLSNVRRLYQLKTEGLKLSAEEEEKLFRGYLGDIDEVIGYVDRLEAARGG